MKHTAALLAAAALFACRAAPTQEEYDDVATGVGALMSENGGGETESFQDAKDAARGEVPTGLASSGSGSFSGRRGALEYSWELTCSDATGAAMTVCGTTTDTARLVLHFDGEASGLSWDAALTRDGDWTLTNLTTDVATLNGRGSFHADSSFTAIYRDLKRSFVLDYEATYDNVKLRIADGVLTAGSIHYEVHAEQTKERRSREITRKLDISADVIFDGSGTAQLVLDGTNVYEVELRAGTVKRVRTIKR